MNHAERVKELALACADAAAFAAINFASKEAEDAHTSKLHAEIDAMQSALDDAVAKLAARDAEISAVRAGLHELIAKLAARDAEVERLKFDLLSLIQANAVLSKALSEEVKGGE